MRKVIDLSKGEETWEEDAPLPQPPTAEETRAAINVQMAAIESQYFMTRGEREGWIALMLNTAAGQGVTEAQLYAANPFYKKLKDANDAIAALRAQL